MILLDSASASDARAAAGLGFVCGVTTNPTLLARAGGAPFDVLGELLEAFDGTVFFQPPSTAVAAAADEALTAHELGGGRVTIKLPATTDFAALAARLARSEVPCALTAVYTPAQALVAAAAGCRWVIPYVDRARRLRPEAPSVVAELRAVGAPPILAASIKSAEQGAEAMRDGAAAITAPLAVIRELAEHELSRRALEEFGRDAARAAAVSRG